MPFVLSAATHLNGTCVGDSVFGTSKTQEMQPTPYGKSNLQEIPRGGGSRFGDAGFAEACVSAEPPDDWPSKGSFLSQKSRRLVASASAHSTRVVTFVAKAQPIASRENR